MEKEVLEYLILIIVISSLILAYCLYVAIDENKKNTKYYKATIYYDTNWEKYSDMVKEQKKVLFKKKTQLAILNCLVFFKGLITWK